MSIHAKTFFPGINADDLQKALEESKRLIEDDDGSLQAALAMSLQGMDPASIKVSSQGASGTSNIKPSTSASDVEPSTSTVKVCTDITGISLICYFKAPF